MKKSFATLIALGLIAQLWAQSDIRGNDALSKKNDSVMYQGTAYAVIVGISNYKYIRPLSFADQDALLFRDFLLSEAGGKVKPENILLLINKEANASAQPRIRRWLSESKMPKKGDRVYFYFAGHGDAINPDEYFFLLYDCDPGGDKNSYVDGMASVIQMYNIKSFIKNDLLENDVEVIFIWDACRTNELPGGMNGIKNMQEGIAEKNNGEMIMLSASAGEVSIENSSYAHGHGLFTYYLIDGLSGIADETDAGGNNDGKVDISELDTWVKMHVRRDAMQKFRTNQNPKFIYNRRKTIGIANKNFRDQWAMIQQKDYEPALNYNNTGNRSMIAADSMVAALYNQFMDALKVDSMQGPNSAEAIYSTLTKKYPGHTLTGEAAFNLAMEYINLAQDKINLYLSGKNERSITNPRSDDNDVMVDISRIKQTTNRNLSTDANYVERAIELLKNNNQADTFYLKQLQAKADFLTAFDLFDDESDSKNYSEALRLAKKAYKTKPDAAYNNLLLGLIYDYNNDFDSALSYERKALALAPAWKYALISIGCTFLYKKVYDSAQFYFRKAAKSYPDYVCAYYNQGLVFYNKKMYDSTNFYFRKAQEAGPGHTADMLDVRGTIFREQHNYDSAMAYYRRAIAFDPLSKYAYANLGYTFSKQNMNDSAEIYYRKAIEIDAKYANAYNGLGLLFSDQHLYDSAVIYYKNAISADAKFVYAYNNLGQTFSDRRLYDSAKTYFYRAINIYPENVFAAESLGYIFYRQKLYDSAKIYYRKAISIDIENAFAYIRLGDVLYEQDLYDSALMCYGRAVIIDRESSGNSYYMHILPAYHPELHNDVVYTYDFINFLSDLGKLDMAYAYLDKWISSVYRPGTTDFEKMLKPARRRILDQKHADKFMCLAFGRIFEKGINTPSNMKEAIKWYTYAANLKSPIAFRALERIYQDQALRNNKEIARLNTLSRETIEKFTVSCNVNGVSTPIGIYIFNEVPDPSHPIQHEVARIKDLFGAEIPAEIISSFEKLYKTAIKKKISYKALCVQELEKATGEKKE
jgi:tetratricopeptide (TPR) repeat protein